MYEIEMGDYSIRILFTDIEEISMDNLDAFYYNTGVKLHPFSITPLSYSEYQEHREYYKALPVDLYLR